MKTCFLHLGLHKTASSSFQKTCALNRELLAEQGLHYPLFSCSYSKPKRLKINNHSVPLRCLYDSNPQDYHINKRWRVSRLNDAIQDYDSQLRQVLTCNTSIILSGEGISLLSVQALTQLANRIHSSGFTLRPFALVRSPLDYAHSISQQLIRGGQHLELVGCAPLVSPLPMKRLKIPDGCRQLSTLKEVFGNQLKLIPFRRACRHFYGPVGFLLEEFCGFSGLDSIMFKNSQESKSNGWVRIQNLINKERPRFYSNNQLNPDYVCLHNDLDFTGKFRLAIDEVELLKEDLLRSNTLMSDLLSEEFVEANESVSEDIFDLDIAKVIIDLCLKKS